MTIRRKHTLETPRRRRLRRKVFIIKMILLFVVFAIIVGGIIFLVRLSYFNVNRVEVQGIETIQKEEVVQIANDVSSGSKFLIVPQKQFFVYPKNKIRESVLSTFGQVKEVSVEREGIRGILITIKERTPTARFCNDECQLLDEAGFAYKKIEDGEFNLLPVIYGTQALETVMFSDLLLFSNRLSDLNLNLKEIKIEPDGSILIVLYEGDVLISLDESLQDQFVAFQTVLKEIKNFRLIDLRYGKKVFYQAE